MSLRVMELGDVPTVVRLHRANLPAGFFVELGDRFLGRYYRTFLTSPAAVALIAEVEGTAVGFLVGATDEVVHHRHVMHLNRWDLARCGMASLLVRPELTARFVRTRARRYLRGMRRRRSAGSAQEEWGRTGVLSHIAVQTRLRGAGVGAALVGGFVEIAKVHGVERLRLFTSCDNEPAQRFYKRLGWQTRPEQCDADGKRWVPFTLDL
ncbi:GNAT family N-acetyltransferase [Allosalinactinospora lopnorensis]|uniref:GNAT family N-acetyltransferase n=1 Tax=Allosalinactinospora lopnorensis TaxID=1352348 RepID=UPI000623D125|nr:GNAT family N-acetyltransferase [Allosalinactinospora lopnorensis]